LELDAADNKKLCLRDGRWLGYAEYGDPAGMPIVYCHGGPSSRLDIAWSDETCRSLGVRMLAVDRPGIGISDRKEGRSVLDFAEDVRDLAQQLQLGAFPVLGWSLGSPFALACGFALPDIVTRVGIIAGIGPLDPQAINALGMQVDKILFTQVEHHPKLLAAALNAVKVLPPYMVRRVLLSELNSKSDIEIVNALTPQHATDFFYEALIQGADGAIDDYRAIANNWGFAIADIKPPIVVWQGIEDAFVPHSLGLRYFSTLPNVDFITLPERGHFLLHKELPHVLKRLLSI
jgi:pimeloyl-ACP methyl ester carboxylesterase